MRLVNQAHLYSPLVVHCTPEMESSSMRWKVLERLPNRTIKAGLPACPQLFLPPTITPCTSRSRPFLPSSARPSPTTTSSGHSLKPSRVVPACRVQSCLPVKIRAVEASHTLLAVYLHSRLFVVKYTFNFYIRQLFRRCEVEVSHDLHSGEPAEVQTSLLKEKSSCNKKRVTTCAVLNEGPEAPSRGNWSQPRSTTPLNCATTSATANPALTEIPNL